MSKNGTYNGGSTIIRPGSDWFSRTESRPAKWDDLRLTYLDAIITAMLQGKDYPNPPLRARTLLDDDVAQAGNPAKWAKAQPEYKHRVGDLTRRLRKAGGKATLSNPRQALADSEAANDPRRKALLEERDKFSQMLRKAEEVVRDCRAGIARVNRKLQQL
ncbi:hypothetical protein [Mesorhizobium sp. M0676]|uniref:hypothetical protein n=1 Tax=Mesorhizobium sp. M0676 TaxID=2956984 RepID=UPI0033356BAE